MRKSMTVLLSGGVAAVAVGALSVTAWAAAAGPSKRQGQVELTTPLGVTLQEVVGSDRRLVTKERKTPGFFAGGAVRRGGRLGTPAYLYADPAGMTLYTYAEDKLPSKSACVAECAKTSPPALVPAGAKPLGSWSVIKRDDGSQQWAYQGKPLYTSVKDEEAGDARGAGGGFTPLRVDPESFVARPFGVGVDDVHTVNGYALVNDIGRAIYAYSRKGEYVAKGCTTTVCPDRWEPVMAPSLARPVGEFAVIDRKDGFQQWAYQGKPLFTYGGDVVRGDAFGVGVSKDFEVAAVARNFKPEGTGMYFDPGRGAIVTTDKGMTLYRVDFSYHNPDGHGLPGSFNGAPAVGRAMGTAPCVDECLKTWRPLAAPANALPSGHWSIMKRSNSTRQWAYKGFAAYTYAGDTKPGERSGSDIYDIFISNDPTIDIYQDGNVYKDDKEMKYGRRVLRARDAAANFWAYIEP